MKTTQFRWLAAMLLLVAAMVMPSTAQAQTITPVQPVGEGTAYIPYLISTAEELYWFAGLVNGDASVCINGISQNRNAWAVLESDITVNSGVLKADGTLADGASGFIQWTPIGNSSNQYIGNFDGQGHTISGLYFNNSGSSNVGLFGYIDKFYDADASCTIQNVGIVDSYFNGYSCVGSVCGYSYSGTISNTGTVIAKDYHSGGICGLSNYSSIEKCYNTGSVEGYTIVGGVAGQCMYGSITNCYNTGSVKGVGTASAGVGGVCETAVESEVTNCYNIGTLSGQTVGNVINSSCKTLTNSYYLADGETDEREGTTAMSADQFANGEVAYLLNGSSPYGEWGQTLSGTDKQDYPVLGGLPVYFRDEVYTNTYGILTVGPNTITTSNEPPIWYEFTPEADGNYRFSSKTILGSICVNTEMTINNMQSMSYSPSYELSAKTTYYVYLYCAPGEYDLTIEKLNSTLKTGDNEIIVSTTGKLWYEFTPTETGSYQFSSTDLEGGNIYVVKNKNATDDSRYIPYAPVYELTADNIYYVAVSYAPGTYALTIKKLDTTLEVGTNEFEVSAPLVWYEFTPSEAGSYQFSSTQLTEGNLYVNTTKSESDYTDITTSPTYDLEAATTYYVAVNYAPGSYDLTITRINNTPTAIEAVTAPQIYAVDGRIVCDGEFRIYDLLGRDVTRLNGSLNGVYVVKTANAAVKVVVR